MCNVARFSSEFVLHKYKHDGITYYGSWHDRLAIRFKCDAKIIENSCGYIYWRNKIFFKNSLVLLVLMMTNWLIYQLRLGLYPMILERIKGDIYMGPVTCHVDQFTIIWFLIDASMLWSHVHLVSICDLVIARLFAQIIKLRAQFQTMKIMLICWFVSKLV